MTTRGQLPPAPGCPHWCGGHEHGTWQVHDAAITKTCRRAITVSEPGSGAVEVIVERFASVEDGRLVVAEPAVRVDVPDALPIDLVHRLSATLLRVAELVREPGVAA